MIASRLLLSGPGVETKLIYVAPTWRKHCGPQRNRQAAESWNKEFYANDFTHVAGPSRPIVGTVTDRQTGKPLAGVTILSQKLAGDPVVGVGEDFIRTVTDAEGHYRLDGMPVGDDNEIGVVSLDQPYWPVMKRVSVDPARDSAKLDFQLRRGVGSKDASPIRTHTDRFPRTSRSSHLPITQFSRKPAPGASIPRGYGTPTLMAVIEWSHCRVRESLA